MGHYLSELGGIFDGPSPEFIAAEQYKRQFFKDERQKAVMHSNTLLDGTLTPTSWLIYSSLIQCNEDLTITSGIPFPHNRNYVSDNTGVSLESSEYVDKRYYDTSEGSVSYSATVDGSCDEESVNAIETISNTKQLRKLASSIPLQHIDASRYSGDSDLCLTWEEARGYNNPLFPAMGRLIIAENMAVTHMTHFDSNRPNEVVSSLVISKTAKFIVTYFRRPCRYMVTQTA